MEPETYMSASQTDFPLANAPKGKKKKKRKVSKSEKLMAKLDKEAVVLKSSPDAFEKFTRKMDQWLRNNHKRAAVLFQKLDQEGDGVVTYSEFKAGMLDLGVPCSGLELHLLAMLLDHHQVNVIDYLELDKGLHGVREREENHTTSDVRPVLQTTDRNLNHCPCCKMATWDGENFKEKYPRYVMLHLRLVTFDSYKNHPGHLSQQVHSHISIHGILQLIQNETQIHSGNLAIFSDKSRDVQYMLSYDQTLEDYDIIGGTLEKPAEITLYYDYKIEFKDCPLLMCDHYFGKNV